MLTNEQFQEKLKATGNGIETNTLYEGNKTVMNCVCKLGHHFKTKAYNLIYNKNGCPVCSGRQVDLGVNDMWTRNPEQAKLLLYKEDGYNYSQASGKRVWWRCPCCGQHLYKKIANVSSKGLSCNRCSDGISFPNRFMHNVLSQLKVDFVAEYMISGANYRYDFYIPKHNLIIEMQGKQHYDGWNSKMITKDEIQLNDANKRSFAFNCGIEKYIEIDARESTKNYLKNKILYSELSSIFDFSNLDWNLCLLNSAKSFVSICSDYYNSGFSTSEISNKIHRSTSSVVKWLKIGNELGLCDWSPSTGFLNDKKPVVLINNGAIYKSVSAASKAVNQSVQGISDACLGKCKYCGIINGKPMIWAFLEDYQNGFFSQKAVENVYLSHHSGIGVNQYSLDGNFIQSFDSIRAAKEATGISTVINVCSKKKYQAGSFRWYYIDDELQPDKTKIYGNPRYYGEDKKSISSTNKTSIDCYDRYGNFLRTYKEHNFAANDTGVNKQQILKNCKGKSAYAGKYVFRYHGESFYAYHYPQEFENYINVYAKESDEFIGTYYSLQEAIRKLNLSGTSSAYKALRKERVAAYGYRFFWANDKSQPDKSKIISKEYM